MEYANQLAYALADPRPGNPDSKGIWPTCIPFSLAQKVDAEKRRLTVADENDALGRENVRVGGTSLSGNYVAHHPSSSFSLNIPEMS